MAGLVRRIPVWVWLFVALTQLLLIPRVVYLLSFPNAALFRYPQDEAYLDLLGICILLPISLGLALWRWRVGRRG